jgi:hypothetical protein
MVADADVHVSEDLARLPTAGDATRKRVRFVRTAMRRSMYEWHGMMPVGISMA